MNYVKSLFINNIDKKNLDQVEVILGFKITRSEKENFSDESHKVENFLKKCNYLNVNLKTHLVIQMQNFSRTFEMVLDKQEYASIIGNL
ncbi:hypothetical protein QL285_013305 [Trifolium repens]|nr:hypothetical protein QL285_013305 [Trifolium repens]